MDAAIEAPCLHAPLSVRAILDATERDNAVARVLLSRGNPVLEQVQREEREKHLAELEVEREKYLAELGLEREGRLAEREKYLAELGLEREGRLADLREGLLEIYEVRHGTPSLALLEHIQACSDIKLLKGALILAASGSVESLESVFSQG